METTERASCRKNHAVVVTNGKDKPAKEVLKVFPTYDDAANHLTSLGQKCVDPAVGEFEIWSSDSDDFSKPRYAY